MLILAIDPGNQRSAYALYDDGQLCRFAKLPNEELVAQLRRWSECAGWFAQAEHLVVEMIANMGMSVGAEVFETCVWVGRFVEAANMPTSYVYRKDVKLHICGSPRAKDGNIRQALIDRYGGASAIGKKKTPGPLYGVAADVWQALAVAVTWTDLNG